MNWSAKSNRDSLKYQRFKGIVGVISSDPPFVECHVGFTTSAFKPLTNKECRTCLNLVENK